MRPVAPTSLPTVGPNRAAARREAAYALSRAQEKNNVPTENDTEIFRNQFTHHFGAADFPLIHPRGSPIGSEHGSRPNRFDFRQQIVDQPVGQPTASIGLRLFP